jgi:hypothetical protein
MPTINSSEASPAKAAHCVTVIISQSLELLHDDEDRRDDLVCAQ